MRILVFLLVVANLAFFAWTQGYLGQHESPDAARLNQQVAVEKLRILSRDEAPAAKAEKPAEKAADKPADASTDKTAEKLADRKPEKCLAWSGLSSGEADRLEALLSERYADLRRNRRAQPLSASWWVFIPPLPNKADADKKAAELKRFGVPEFFIVQDAGPNRFAISLGIFSSEEAAGERLEALKGKGVRSAKVGRRDSARSEHYALDASGAEALVEAVRDAVQQALPTVKSAACGN